MNRVEAITNVRDTLTQGSWAGDTGEIFGHSAHMHLWRAFNQKSAGSALDFMSAVLPGYGAGIDVDPTGKTAVFMYRDDEDLRELPDYSADTFADAVVRATLGTLIRLGGSV